MPNLINISGRTFGLWRVHERIPASGGPRYRCVCECGTEKAVLSNNLVRGHSTNCGCVRRVGVTKRNTKHGASPRGSHDLTYESWKHMRGRCMRREHKDFAYYGGRGIAICARWQDFSAFLADMGPRPPGLTLDRVDVNGNYEPTNCRWATRKQQTDNRRPVTQRYARGEEVAGAKLTEEIVRAIRADAQSVRQRVVAARYGVTQSLVSQIVRRRVWAHVA